MSLIFVGCLLHVSLDPEDGSSVFLRGLAKRLSLSGLHDVTSHKMQLFTAITLRTSGKTIGRFCGYLTVFNYIVYENKIKFINKVNQTNSVTYLTRGLISLWLYKENNKLRD
jgi:hypothetical protein